MSSGLCMYKMRPVVNHDEMKVQFTHNMYKMRPINGYIDRTSLVSLQKLIGGRVEEILKKTVGDIPTLETRQEEILKKLAELKLNMKNLREELNSKPDKTTKKVQGIHVKGCEVTTNNCQPCKELEDVHNVVVVCASPQYPPYSLLGLVNAWGPSCPLKLQTHTHSSIATTPDVAKLFTTSPLNGKPCLTIIVIWKDVGPYTELIVSPLKHVTIRGETNILRFLSRVGPQQLSYENDADLVRVTKVDELLDVCETLITSGSNKERQSVIKSLSASLGKGAWLCGRDQLSIADVAAWSAFKQVINSKEIPQSMNNWFEQCNSILGNTQC